MATNQSTSGLNRVLPSNFWWLRSANHVKFTENCVISTYMYVLVKKMFTNGLNIGLILWAFVKNTVHRVEAHWLFGKENILGATVSKEGLP